MVLCTKATEAQGSLKSIAVVGGLQTDYNILSAALLRWCCHTISFLDWFGSRSTGLNTDSTGHVKISQTSLEAIGRQQAQTVIQPTS